MTFRGIFIDDTKEEKVYAKMLSGSSGSSLDIDYAEVSDAGSLTDTIFKSRIDIVILDYRLDDNPEMIDPKCAYKASGLSQMLRDKAIAEPKFDFPIVLLSAENNYKILYRPDTTAHDLFDRTYIKEYLIGNIGAVKNEMLALCDGYSKIKVGWDADDRLDLFEASPDVRAAVDIQELRFALKDAAAPHIAARVILRDVIDRTGLLLSDLDVAARLGISPETVKTVAQLLEAQQIQYSGVFSGGWRRWWAHRFDPWAEEIFGRRPHTLTGKERAKILSEKFGLEIASATSTWNHSTEERFSFACVSCGRPSEIRHSVAAYDPIVPRFGQRRRICWDCIQTDRNQDKYRVDQVDSNLIPMIMIKKRDDDE